MGMGENLVTRKLQVSVLSAYQGKPFWVPISDPQPHSWRISPIRGEERNHMILYLTSSAHSLMVEESRCGKYPCNLQVPDAH